ncbi:uncharacterized protein BDR25DRAFT_225704 [Lindgomyces ingoldianus]|uniref:Uncharacterized protein n=1 Tax=Lindgomyces ingoldianus TaxID=673940 RepID=A0ACB6QTX6_9PLEO|nr:uncharacterized protein BDR25DRAFT_225704 [Lindgomyces ingoldianus]KAF2470312.1 hypothetical protein BDR25DRAFT_225704 [Lindgomyces ingoldianus]
MSLSEQPPPQAEDDSSTSYGDAGWDEVERMAQAMSAEDAQEADKYPSSKTISRWMNLFNYSHFEAVQLISQQRGDLTRDRISDEHWDLIKEEREAIGYDREAYEHSLHLGEVLKSQSATIHTAGENGETMTMFRLGGLLDTAKKVQEVAGLETTPSVVQGISHRGPAEFCCVDKDAFKNIEAYLAQQLITRREP